VLIQEAREGLWAQDHSFITNLSEDLAELWWLNPVILATWEGQIRRILV
jgi:hypothetical protein